MHQSRAVGTICGIFPAAELPTGNAADFPDPPLSQAEKSVPSLWLAQKLFGGKLLDRWFVDPGNTWVIIIVNRQLSSLLDYMERYQFVNRFGTVASEYGYNVRVCNRQGTALAVYSCQEIGVFVALI